MMICASSRGSTFGRRNSRKKLPVRDEGGVRDGVCDDEAGSPRFGLGFGISSSSRTIGKTTALLSLPTFFLLVLLLQI